MENIYSPRKLNARKSTKAKAKKMLYGIGSEEEDSPRKVKSPRKVITKQKSPRASPKRISLDDTIEIDKDIVERARKQVREENELRKKFNIPKQYKGYRLDDIPLSKLSSVSVKRKSPNKK